MTRMARIIALVLATAMLSGCATITTAELANPSNEGEVEQHKYGIYDATAATKIGGENLVVCIFGNGQDKDKFDYSLALKVDENGLDHRQISVKSASDELISEYEMALREIGGACGDPPAGSTVRLIALNFPERGEEPRYAGHTPVTSTELRNLLSGVEEPTGLAVVKVRRAPTCTEVFVWNPAAESPDSELVRISTPTEKWTVTGNRAWYILTPFAVLFDVATFPLQFVVIFYNASYHHQPYC